jgi:hypothetical protein
LTGDVQLRLSGLRHNGVKISEINPAQATVGQFSLTDMTADQMRDNFAQCVVTLSWDGNPALTLPASEPYRQ